MFLSKKLIISTLLIFLLILANKNIILILNLIALFYFFLRHRIQKKLGILILFLLTPIILAGFHGIFFFPKYDVFRDIFYFLFPLASLILGILIAEKFDAKTILRSVVIVGTTLSIIKIVGVFSSFGFSAFNDLREVRYKLEGWSIITTIALILCIFACYIYKLRLIKSILFTKILIFINGLAFLFSGSRTFWVIFLVMMLSLMYPIYRNSVRFFIKILIFTALLLSLISYLNLNSGFTKSILNITTELSVGDYTEASDMNTKYRGWETYRALVTYIDGNIFQILFGHGAGKMIDLGTYFHVGGSGPDGNNNDTTRFIPILHNGYMFILVKSGLFGLFCYLLYFSYLFRFAVKKIEFPEIQKNFQPLFLIGTLISIYVSNIVISGLFNSELELLGVICGLVFYHLSHSKNIELSLQTK